MQSEMNQRVLLKKRPNGMPSVDDFELVNHSLDDIEEGEILIKIQYLSADPYQRGLLAENPLRGTVLEIGSVIPGGAVGEVLVSRNPNFKSGQMVEGRLGWQKFAKSDGVGIRKIDPNLAPLSSSLGVLGMPGMTAYFGFLEVCLPVPGDVVVVSAAAGAVGSLVGQIAKIMGCKVVGIAGSLEKKTYLLETLNFDAVINYKTQDVDKTLRDECPEGVDVYFDNVGGIISDMVISQLNVGGRVAVCGQISLYNLSEPELAPRFLSTLIYRNIRIEGFVVSKWNSRYPEGITRMAKWIKEGLIQYEEHVIHGLENAPQGLIDVLSGNNLGKVIIKI